MLKKIMNNTNKNKIRIAILSIVLFLILGMSSLITGCTAQDSLGSDIYTWSIFPSSNTTYDLGSNTLEWNNLWVSNINGAPYVPGVAAPHDLLSITHPDTTPDSVVRGDLITGQGIVPTWSRLALGGASTFLASDATDAGWRTLIATDIPDLSGTYVPYLGASAAVDLGTQTLTTTGLVGIGTPPAANNLLSVYYNAGGGASVTALDITENSASAGARGIELSVLGAKTATTYGMSIYNAAASSTAGIDKYALYLRSDSNWDGLGSTNYGLFIDEPIGGTTNWTIYTTGGTHYFGGATSINGALNMLTHQINNVVDPILAQDAATKNYVDTGLGGIYVPYSGATGNIDLNAKEVTNGTLNAMVLKGTFTNSGVVTFPAFTFGGAVNANLQTLGVLSTVTIANNTNIQWLDSGGIARNVLAVSASGNFNVSPPSGGDFNFFVNAGGTGRTSTYLGSDASAGTPTRNSPTLALRANYWNGAASTAWLYRIINTMTGSGATPASTATHSINNVAIMDMTNTNGTPTGRLYGRWGINGSTPINGFLNVSGTMTNTTAGSFAFATFSNNINPAVNSSSEFRSLYFQNVLIGTGVTYSSIRSGFFENRVRTDGLINQIVAVFGVSYVVDSSSPATTSVNNVYTFLADVASRPSGTSTSSATTAVAYFVNAVGNAGFTATNAYSFYGANPIGTITNAFGLFLPAITSGTTLNYAIYSAGGHSYHAGNLGLGIAESSVLTLKAGTATAGTSPLKLTSGTLLTAPEAGSIEYLTPRLYYTDGGSVRQTLIPDAYGQLYTDDTTDNITITTAGTYYQWMGSTAGLYHLTTLSVASDNITIDSGGDGVYRVSINISVTADSNNHLVHGALFVDGVKVPQVCTEVFLQNAAEQSVISANGLVTLTAGQVLDLRMTGNTDGMVVTISHAQLTASRVAR